MGTNFEAAKYTGIKEKKVRMYVYILAGLLAAISAIINNSWLMTARADAGTGMEMQAITVAVLGGIGVARGNWSFGWSFDRGSSYHNDEFRTSNCEY